MRLATVVAVVLAVFAAGCGSESKNASTADTSATAKPAKKETGPIVIGEAIGKSGAMEYFDVPASIGAKIAIEEINAAGGIDGRQVKLVTGDHQSDPNKGVQAAEKVFDQGANILLVSCNYEQAAAAARVSNQKKKVVFSYCAGEPQFSRQSTSGRNSYTFDMGQATNGVGASMAEFAHSKGWKNAYVLQDTWINYTNEMCKYFNKAWDSLPGTSVAGRDKFVNTDTSIAGQIAKLKSAKTKPDVVVACTVLPGGATALRQLRAAGIDQPIVTGDGMDSAETPKGVPNLSDFYETVVASTYGDDPDPKVNEFFKKFEKRSGAAADGSYAIFGYAIIQALKVAIEKTHSTNGDVLKAELEKFNKEPLIVGPMTFTKTERVDASRPEKVIQIQKGKPSYLQTVEPKNIPAAE